MTKEDVQIEIERALTFIGRMEVKLLELYQTRHKLEKLEKQTPKPEVPNE